MNDPDAPSEALFLGTCPVNWNNNDLEDWRPITPFPSILDRMLEAGYRATEYDASFGSNSASVQRELQSRGMVLTGSYQWVDFLECGSDASCYDHLRPMLQFLKDVECTNLIVSDPLRPYRVALAGRVPADGSESLDSASYQRIADGVHTLAAIAEEYGIDVRYHNHVGSWIEAPHEVDALLKCLDASRADLCFDTGHYAYGGGDPNRFIRENIGSIGYLHLKDVDTNAVEKARASKLTFLEALRSVVFSAIGTGSVDIPAILSILTEHRFAGWIIVEQDTCPGDPTVAARNNKAFIDNWLNEHHPVGR